MRSATSACRTARSRSGSATGWPTGSSARRGGRAARYPEGGPRLALRWTTTGERSAIRLRRAPGHPLTRRSAQMTAELMIGTDLAAEMVAKAAERAAALQEQYGVQPCLA